MLNFICRVDSDLVVATPEQVANIIMFRGLGFSQQEISEAVDLSRQAVAYQLKKLKKDALLYGATHIFSERTGMTKAESKDLEDALVMVEILREEEDLGDIVVDEWNVRQTIRSYLGNCEWATLPEIHFYLARTFLGFNGSPSKWKKGWPAKLSTRLGWSKSLTDEIKGVCGDDVEFKGLGNSVVTKARWKGPKTYIANDEPGSGMTIL